MTPSPTLTTTFKSTVLCGKTARLISAAVEVGALVAAAPPELVAIYRAFGHDLGLAFQVQDDLLGIWGEPEVTAKSAATDLQTRKKSLPVIIGLEHSPEFARRFARPPSEGEDLTPLIAELEAVSADEYCRAQSERLTLSALSYLEAARPAPELWKALRELAARLTGREA